MVRRLIVLLACAHIAMAFVVAQERDLLGEHLDAIQEGKKSVPELLAGYREMIRREPQNPLGYVLAASVYNRSESRTLYEKAIAIAPDYLAARAGFGRYLLREGNAKEAMPHLVKAVTLDSKDSRLLCDAIAAAVRSGNIALAKSLAKDDTKLRAEIVLAYIDAEKFNEGKKALIELDLESDTSIAAMNARGRLMYYSEQKAQGVALLIEAWRKGPDSLDHYRFSFPRRSLVQLLNEARRQINVDQELRELYSRGIELFPKEYPLYEGVWKMKFADVKTDYSAERQAVKEQVEKLLRTHPPDPELYKVAALGFKMAELPDEAERINQKVKTEFPYSMPALWVRRGEATREKDPNKKLSLIENFNRDFVTLTLHKDYFETLIELSVPNQELLKGAELYIKNQPHVTSKVDVSEVFLDKHIYLDRVAQWLVEARERDPQVAHDAWSGRLATTYARLLLVRGRRMEAERVLRPIIDLRAQGFSGVDRGKAKFRLAQVLEVKGKLAEAMEMYAQAYAESQHYLADAGVNFRRVYRHLNRGDKGMDEYLERRDDTFAVAADTGIERGSKIDKPAPDFNMLSLSGERVSLASLKGKVVIVNFWATWCGPCIKEMPHLQEFADKMKDDSGVALLAITTDENRALVAPFIRQHAYTFPVLFNEGVSAKFGVRGIPATFIIDPEGIIRLRMVGFNINEPLVPYLEKLVTQYRKKSEEARTK